MLDCYVDPVIPCGIFADNDQIMRSVLPVWAEKKRRKKTALGVLLKSGLLFTTFSGFFESVQRKNSFKIVLIVWRNSTKLLLKCHIFAYFMSQFIYF